MIHEGKYLLMVGSRSSHQESAHPAVLNPAVDLTFAQTGEAITYHPYRKLIKLSREGETVISYVKASPADALAALTTFESLVKAQIEDAEHLVWNGLEQQHSYLETYRIPPSPSLHRENLELYKVGSEVVEMIEKSDKLVESGGSLWGKDWLVAVRSIEGPALEEAGDLLDGDTQRLVHTQKIDPQNPEKIFKGRHILIIRASGQEDSALLNPALSPELTPSVQSSQIEVPISTVSANSNNTLKDNPFLKVLKPEQINF